jgi:hypothetical protein
MALFLPRLVRQTSELRGQIRVLAVHQKIAPALDECNRDYIQLRRFPLRLMYGFNGFHTSGAELKDRIRSSPCRQARLAIQQLFWRHYFGQRHHGNVS